MKTIKRNITIYDIAKEAGVSPSTVSRVLTGKVHVKEATRRKIEKIIKKYNYRPNALARSLYYKKSRMIGCILPDITNPFYSQLFSELEKNATANGYSIILGNSLNNLELESKYLDLFLEKQVDGIV
ncbi:MAG TPA: LacI family transcriptional regulator, partial [Thermotogaceae bacterium]|nr:LacI family transcriptional regulator [Thermotogaceae bacterium]